MQKLIAVVLIMIGSVSAGFFAALREKRRIKLLLELSGNLQAARWELTANRTEAELLLSRHFSKLGENREMIGKKIEALPLKSEEKEILSEFFYRFGSGDQLCECERCLTTAAQLKETAERDREESDKKAKLYLSGGMLGGLFLTLLII